MPHPRVPPSRRVVLLGGLALGAPAAWALPPAEKAQEIEWVGGDLPPFVWQVDGQGRGYAHDLALAMARRLGRPERVQFLPWARAVKMTAEGEPYGVFPLARTADREARFQWLIPLMQVSYTLFVRADAPAEWGQAALLQRKVAVLRGSPIINNLREAGFSLISEATHYRDMLRMLDEGMVSAAYAGTPMFRAAMRESGRTTLQYRELATLGEATLYMAAATTISPAEALRWQDAYRALQADGTVERLRERYGLGR